MIIELVGLSGSGKTTLARALEKRGAVLVNAPRGFVLATETLRFCIGRPYAFFKIAVRTWKVAPARLRKLLFINLVLVHAAKYSRARRISKRGKTAIIDQGFFQNLLAAFSQPPSEADLESYAKFFPVPNQLLHVIVPNEKREEQLVARGVRARAEYGDRVAQEFDAVAQAVMPHIEPLLRRLCVPYLSGSPAELSQIDLMLEGPYRPEALRETLKHLSYGILMFFRYFLPRKREAVILMYHAVDYSSWRLAVTPGAFEYQMRYIATQGLARHLTEVVAYQKERLRMPLRAVAVTFDDGYRDLLTTIFPIIERYAIPITIFVPSDLSARTDREGRPRLTADELRKLAASPLVSIESHARTHTKLTELTTHEAAEEIRESAIELSKTIGKKPRFFAYPFGARTEVHDKAIEEARYDAGFGITDGLVSVHSPRFALPRVQVDATVTFFLFRARLTRAVEWHRNLFGSLRGIL